MKLHIHDLYTEKQGSQIPSAKCARKHSSGLPKFLPKSSLSKDALHTLVKK